MLAFSSILSIFSGMPYKTCQRLLANRIFTRQHHACAEAKAVNNDHRTDEAAIVRSIVIGVNAPPICRAVAAANGEI